MIFGLGVGLLSLLGILVGAYVARRPRSKGAPTSHELVMMVTEWIMANGSTEAAEAFRLELARLERERRVQEWQDQQDRFETEKYEPHSDARPPSGPKPQ